MQTVKNEKVKRVCFAKRPRLHYPTIFISNHQARVMLFHKEKDMERTPKPLKLMFIAITLKPITTPRHDKYEVSTLMCVDDTFENLDNLYRRFGSLGLNLAYEGLLLEIRDEGPTRLPQDTPTRQGLHR
jgi:hypothetical protein